MFNSPLLDVTIGLVFIFLLYSLLSTTIHEIIATVLKLRSRMLKRAIIEGMLSNTPGDSFWTIIRTWTKNFFDRFKDGGQLNFVQTTVFQKFLSWPVIRHIRNFFRTGTSIQNNQGIGHDFYGHPLIKNYGSSRMFPLPSYIPTKNFSTVLIDVLKDNFRQNLDDIAVSKLPGTATPEQINSVRKDLQNSTDIIKIKELLDFHTRHYDENPDETKGPIDKDTAKILRMHLINSVYDIEKFTGKLESWYDDSQERVSGWYKRQSRFISLFIGLAMAVAFNVDVLMIANKLSVDKEAREKIVQMAVQAADKYKDDPRIKKTITNAGVLVPDPSPTNTDTLKKVFSEYKARADEAKKTYQEEVKTANEILAVGWGDYGMKNYHRKILEDNGIYIRNELRKCPKDKNLHSCLIKTYDNLSEEHWIKYNKNVYKLCYIIRESAHLKKLLGFIILAFAVSLGAPFWFDLLNKLVKIRSTGKQESGSGPPGATSNTATPQISVTLNSPNPSEEAAG
jgi:hypothetical protein